MNGRICALYVPGLDHRLINSTETPRIHQLLTDHPPVMMRTQPTTEIFPSLVTGVNPDRHEIWHVSLRSDADAQPPRWYDRLPDGLTTTVQCLRYLVDRSYELPAIPPRRRRRFDLHRLKFDLRINHPELCNSIGGMPSLFGILGDQACYSVIKHFSSLDQWTLRLPDPDRRFDMLEFHAFDLASHWNLDRPSIMRGYLRRLDAFVGEVRVRCEAVGVTFMLVVDHGQERIVRTIDLRRGLRELDVPDHEYDYFLAVAVCRFWFHSDRARQKITAMLESLKHVNVLTCGDLAKWGCGLEPTRFGVLYAVTDQGTLFFPHDFYHPVGNAFMGIRNPLMRSRLLNGCHRGYHGHLPNHPAEMGYISVADPAWQPNTTVMDVIDYAPTVLHMLGVPKAAHMTGRSMYRQAM